MPRPQLPVIPAPPKRKVHVTFGGVPMPVKDLTITYSTVDCDTCYGTGWLEESGGEVVACERCRGQGSLSVAHWDPAEVCFQNEPAPVVLRQGCPQCYGAKVFDKGTDVEATCWTCKGNGWIEVKL